MPVQLKVIVEEGYTQNAPITVNFAAPVIIQPGQKIALDKFTAVVNGITTGFTLASTSFILSPSVNSPNFQSVVVSVPSKYYLTVAALLTDLTTYCNNALDAYNAGFLPDFGITRYYRDEGLKIGCSANNNAFQMQYTTASSVELIMTEDNLSPDTDGFFSPDAAGQFTMEQSDQTQYLVQGGGSILEFQVRVPSIEEAQANNVSWHVGLVDDTGGIHGLEQLGDTGVLTLINGASVTPVDIANFPSDPDAYCQIYQAKGKFVLRTFYRNPDTGLETPIYNSSALSPGALGSQDYTQQYHFEFAGVTEFVTNPTVPGVNGTKVFMTIDIPFGTAPAAGLFARTLGFDMTNAGSLRAGLDVPSGINFLTPNSASAGAYLASQPINMSVINYSFDIAIEVLNLPLQTYQASSNGTSGQRNNVISYFHPELSAVGTSVYIYDSKAYQWLDIDISYPINLSSMSFRVYNPVTGLDLNANSMTFNFLINDTEY